MPRLRDQRVRAILGIIALMLIGAASYQIGVSVWSNWKYNAACEALERHDFSQAGELLENYLSFHPADPVALMGHHVRPTGLAGHSTPALTARYSRCRLYDLAGAVEKLPNFLPVSEGDRTDGHLLDCFIEQQDDAAFAALVRRYGPMVWGVCRRMVS